MDDSSPSWRRALCLCFKEGVGIRLNYQQPPPGPQVPGPPKFQGQATIRATLSRTWPVRGNKITVPYVISVVDQALMTGQSNMSRW